MPTPSGGSTFKENVKNGIGWGIGFALVSVPIIGGLKLLWHAIIDDDNPYAKIPDYERNLIVADRLRQAGVSEARIQHEVYGNPYNPDDDDDD